MKTINRKATSKASLLRALRANNINFGKVTTVKRATNNKVGTYRVVIKKKR